MKDYTITLWVGAHVTLQQIKGHSYWSGMGGTRYFETRYEIIDSRQRNGYHRKFYEETGGRLSKVRRAALVRKAEEIDAGYLARMEDERKARILEEHTRRLENERLEADLRMRRAAPVMLAALDRIAMLAATGADHSEEIKQIAMEAANNARVAPGNTEE